MRMGHEATMGMARQVLVAASSKTSRVRYRALILGFQAGAFSLSTARESHMRQTRRDEVRRL